MVTKEQPQVHAQVQPQRIMRIIEAEDVQRPTLGQYLDLFRDRLHSMIPVDTDDSQKTISRSHKHNSEANPTSSHHYGVLVGKLPSFKGKESGMKSKSQGCHDSRPLFKDHTATPLRSADLTEIIRQHRLESIGLAIVILGFIAYFVLEVIEITLKSCLEGRFPDRGRGRVRLKGRERELRAWSNSYREKSLAN